MTARPKSSGDYPTTISGFRLLGREERPPDGTIWFFQTKNGFSKESALILFSQLPNGYDIGFLDVWKREEDWFFVRRDGERFFVKRGRGIPPWNVETIERIVEWFIASPLVSKPLESLESFTVSSIPEHLRDQHLNENSA